MFHALSILAQGGWPIMTLLALCSFVAVAVIIERSIALQRSKIIDPRILQLAEKYDDQTSEDGALLTCRRAKGPFARIVEEILKTRHLDHAQIMETMHAAGRTQIGSMERGLTVLEIIAGISPLIGLLGTVLGMYTVFEAITVEGIGNPRILSDGIRQALITTVAGLTVAIPALALHSWFAKRVDDLAVEMQERATSFIIKVLAQQGRK